MRKTVQNNKVKIDQQSKPKLRKNWNGKFWKLEQEPQRQTSPTDYKRWKRKSQKIKDKKENG